MYLIGRVPTPKFERSFMNLWQKTWSAICSTKISQGDLWSPMHISILMDSSFGWYLPTFQVSLRLAEKWQSYHQRKHFFRPKSVRHDLWSSMHIGILMDSSLGWYLTTFEVSSKSAEKWLSYRRRKPFFRPKSLKREGWSPMHIEVRGHQRYSKYLPPFQVSSRLGSRNEHVINVKPQTLTRDREEPE